MTTCNRAKRRARVLLTLGISLVLAGTGTGAALAETVRSVPLVFTAGSSQNLATARMSNDGVLSAGATTERLGDDMAAAWQLGAAARIFDQSGAICRASELTFNWLPVTGHTAGWNGGDCGAQHYYSVGLHASSDGKGYVLRDSNRTASLPYPVPAHAVNSSGETYGASTGVGTDPDLLLAIGDDGERGYLRRTELYPEPSSPADAAARMAELAEQAAPSIVIPGATEVRREHPLYASDGRTVIGVFTTTTLLDIAQR